MEMAVGISHSSLDVKQFKYTAEELDGFGCSKPTTLRPVGWCFLFVLGFRGLSVLLETDRLSERGLFSRKSVNKSTFCAVSLIETTRYSDHHWQSA